MESTLEKIVKKKLTLDDYLSSLLLIIGAFVLVAISTIIPNFYQYWLVFIVIIIFLCWYLIRRKHIEYEYSYFDGEFQFDKIIAKRGRKKVANIRIYDIEVFGKATKNIINEKQDKFVMASSLESSDLYYFITNHLGKRTFFYFEPSEEMVEEIKRRIPSKIAR